MKPIALDLFSGCGGLTLGLKQAGFNVIAAVEFDHLAAETYRLNHPEVQVWERDICEIDGEEILSKFNLRPGELDLLAGCPPCQGFSNIKTLNGFLPMDDDRNDLVFHYLRLVWDIQPKSVMMENVPGLAKDQRIAVIEEALNAMGYVIQHDVLDAAEFGVPQRRKRFILLAGHEVRIPFARRTRRKRTVREAFENLGPEAAFDAVHQLGEDRTQEVRDKIARIPKDGGGRLDLGPDDQLECHKKCNGFKDVYGRMAWDDVAPTITGGCFNPSKGRFLHPDEDRAITMREAGLLQTFPVNYFFSVENGKCAVAQMIGNALPPEFIKRHAKKVIRFLEKYAVTCGG